MGGVMISNLASNDTFNARHKSPAEVANGFIPPPQFDELLGFNNCILVGPRGSGKTTLLKMLQVPALVEWGREGGRENYKDIKFVGVFVAADVRWAKQLELVTRNIVDQNHRTLIHEASFSNFVKLSLVESLEKAISLGVIVPPPGKEFDRHSEAELTKKLCDIWKIRYVPSLSALKHELRVQQSDIPSVAESLAALIGWEIIKKDHPSLTTGWLNAFTLAVETINDHLRIESQKWALLVDELEIIPHDLLVRILYPLRSTTANLIFKFALSPTGGGSQLLLKHEDADPTQGNDFSTLRLWNTKKEDTRLFASKLLKQGLLARGLIFPESELSDVLGSFGALEEADNQEASGRFSIESRRKIFEELSNKDSSFREYLEDKKVNVKDLKTSDSSSSGTLVRKITPLVFLRNHVLKGWDNNKAEKRSKISSQPYQRYPNILDLTEGNPRWILNLAEYLSYQAGVKKSDLNTQGVQAEAIKSFKDRFISMLTVYPVGEGPSSLGLTPFDILSTLGEAIKERVHFNAFSPDPALSFVIDKSAADKYGDLISICIHLGALVLVDSDSSRESAFIPGSSGLEGRCVRICNRLAPQFFIPLRAGRSIQMSTALNIKTASLQPEPKTNILIAKSKSKTKVKALVVQDVNSQMKLF
ncbi:ORC-CDC6 family AAA ATPase [Pseudomonas putida]|uniref:ORC-CDC6 family AAA ATPase n=1 Tax=Pseudomonas putida TaxID=303 RepID=UPI001146CBD0|nr:hypothetical protein [Pseudomonas putida]